MLEVNFGSTSGQLQIQFMLLRFVWIPHPEPAATYSILATIKATQLHWGPHGSAPWVWPASHWEGWVSALAVILHPGQPPYTWVFWHLGSLLDLDKYHTLGMAVYFPRNQKGACVNQGSPQKQNQQGVWLPTVLFYFVNCLFFILKNVYSAVSALSCGMQDLHWSMQDPSLWPTGFTVVVCGKQAGLIAPRHVQS